MPCLQMGLKEAHTLILLGLSSLCLLALADGIPCPLECSCYDVQVHCTEPSLTSIPKVPYNTEELYISGNNIGVLYGISLRNLSRLAMLSISNTQLHRIEKDAFVGLHSLRELSLGRNSLSGQSFSGAEAETFRPLRETLKTLDLSGNQFVLTPHAQLQPLTNLEKLNMSGNQLTSALLGPGFSSIDKIKVLDFSHNFISRLVKLSFQHLRRHSNTVYKTIDLSYNNMDIIEENALGNLPMLASVDLSGNSALTLDNLRRVMGDIGRGGRLQELKLSSLNLTELGDLFSGLRFVNLEKLDLSWNHLESVQSHVLSFLSHMVDLNLAGNKLRHLPANVFNRQGNLVRLNVDDNHLESWNALTFEDLTNLNYLSASGNQFTVLDPAPFAKLFKLKTINMDRNQISAIGDQYEHIQGLSKLSLSQNRFTSLDILLTLRNLEYLDVSYNSLTELGSGAFPGESSLRMFNVSHNKIKLINPKIFSEYSPLTIDLSHNMIETLPDVGWAQSTSVSLAHNQISHLNSRAFTKAQVLESLDLSHNSLEKLPENMVSNLLSLQHLLLSHNKLYMFTNHMVVFFAKPTASRQLPLQSLDLSYNSISLFRAGFFQNLTNLRRLDLSGNMLTHVDSDILVGLSNLRQVSLANNKLTVVDPNDLQATMPQLQKIDASGNPFKCDCSLLPLLKEMENGKIQFPHYHTRGKYTCASPSNRQSLDLKNANISSDNCKGGIAERTIILIAIGCTAFVVLVAVSILFWQHRWRLKRKLKKERYRAIYEASNQNGKDSSEQSESFLHVQHNKQNQLSHPNSPYISTQGTPRGPHREKILPNVPIEMSPRSNRYARDSTSAATTYAPVGSSQYSGSDRSHFGHAQFEAPPPPLPALTHFESSPYFPHCGLGARRNDTNRGIHPAYAVTTALSSSGGSSSGRGGSSHSQVSGYSTPEYQAHGASAAGREFV